MHREAGEEVVVALFRGSPWPCTTTGVPDFFGVGTCSKHVSSLFLDGYDLSRALAIFSFLKNLFGLTGVGVVAALPTAHDPSVCVFALFPRGRLPVSRGTGGGTFGVGGVGGG